MNYNNFPNELQNNNLDSQITKLKELLQLLEKIRDKSSTLTFLTVDDIIKATGYSKTTVLNIFKDPEFPSCDYGKAQIVEINAAINYFSVPRKKAESNYWRSVA